jgi:hypothetical protein
MEINSKGGCAMGWENPQTLDSKKYICGYCGNPLVSSQGYYATKIELYPDRFQTFTRHTDAYIYICHHCNNPTYFADDDCQYPGATVGSTVDHIPAKAVEALYEEARSCMTVYAHTAAVMCCRKLLMNVAVSEGAKEGLKFWQYVDYLANEGHITVRAKKWVDHIRDKGNDANHEIKMMDREDAERLIKFSEMLLKTMYEYPAEAEGPS